MKIIFKIPVLFTGGAKYGPTVPVSLLFPGPGFCGSRNILLLAAKIPAKAKKVKEQLFNDSSSF
jgi:hypothetical protein